MARAENPLQVEPRLGWFTQKPLGRDETDVSVNPKLTDCINGRR